MMGKTFQGFKLVISAVILVRRKVRRAEAGPTNVPSKFKSVRPYVI